MRAPFRSKEIGDPSRYQNCGLEAATENLPPRKQTLAKPRDLCYEYSHTVAMIGA
jgi:hypothetical protein